METRIATLNDIKALCPLLTEFFTYNAGLQPLYNSEAVEDGEYPKIIIEGDNSDFLIAVDNGAVVGFIHIEQMKTQPYNSVVQHNYAEIIAFMVTASHRAHGVGTKLLDAAKEWSKERNLDYIELISMINADDANLFYDKKGFKTVSYIRRQML